MKKHIVHNYKRIEQEEVVIANENVLPTTLTSEPFIASDLVIVLNHSGSADCLFDMQPVTFNKHNIAVTLPNHIIGSGQCTDDYSTTVIVIARDFFDELVNRESFMGYIKYKTYPNFQLSEEQYNQVVTILNTIQFISEFEHIKRHEMLANLLDMLFYALTRYRGEEEQDKTISRNAHIFNAFCDLLIDNYPHQHQIEWYAQHLYLTPKYFSKIIKNTTGKSAAQWINEVLILHAKRLLYTRRDMTIQQVAYELGFKENATFCRFFKDQTGLRPSEYRKQR